VKFDFEIEVQKLRNEIDSLKEMLILSVMDVYAFKEKYGSIHTETEKPKSLREDWVICCNDEKIYYSDIVMEIFLEQWKTSKKGKEEPKGKGKEEEKPKGKGKDAKVKDDKKVKDDDVYDDDEDEPKKKDEDEDEDDYYGLRSKLKEDEIEFMGVFVGYAMFLDAENIKESDIGFNSRSYILVKNGEYLNLYLDPSYSPLDEDSSSD